MKGKAPGELSADRAGRGEAAAAASVRPVANSRRPAVTDPFLPRRKAFTIPARSTMPAASASSPTCTTASRTTSCRRACKFCSISTIAARSAPTPRPATAAACSSRSRIVSSRTKRPARLLAARARPLCGRPVVHAARPPRRAAIVEAIIEEVVAEEGQMLLGWRDVPVDHSRPRRERQADRARPSPDLHRPRRATSPTRTRSSASCSSCARSSPTASTTWPTRATRRASIRSRCRRRTIVYKGMLLATPARRLFQGPARPAVRDRARARAPALLDQHLPDLAARPSLPDGRP